MVRLLIISYYFPPAAGGGVQRVLKLAKYLPEFGVEVHVLAPDDPKWVDRDEALEVPEGTTVHRTRYLGPPPGKPADMLAGTRGLLRAWTRLKLQPRRVLVPDLHAGWALTAVRAGRRVCREHSIDVVMSTSPPETDHVIGHRIRHGTGLPWIADLRDSWLAEPGLRLDKRLVRAKLRLNKRISDRTIGTADLILTVSEPIAEELGDRYPKLEAEGKIHVLMNGVDLQDFEQITPREDQPNASDRFTILYTGNFFGRRTPRPFLSALLALLERRPDLRETVRVRFIGSLKPDDAAWIDARPTLRAVIAQESFLPYAETLAAQTRADVLLLAIASGDRHQGEITGKLFEYVAARRPILAVIPPHGAAAELLERAGSATIVNPDESGEIERAIEDLYNRWQTGGTPLVELSPATEALISRRERAKQLADLLHRLQKQQDPA